MLTAQLKIGREICRFISPLRDRQIGRGRAVIVCVPGELAVVRAPRKSAADEFAQFVDLIPGDNPELQGLGRSGLLFLFDGFE